MTTEQIAASACAGISVFFAFLVIVDFIGYIMAHSRERYLRGAAVELDDILLQAPASRVLDISFALSGLAAILAILLVGLNASAWSWNRIILIGIVAGALAFPTPRFYLRYLRQRRLIRFNEQLEDGLMTMCNSLKAGFSINQALDAVVAENRRPISVEFRVLTQEVRLGVSLDDALRKMCDRINSEDFELVASAIITARQTGGELTTVFERLANMIRERARINGRLRALTAMGKLQAMVISFMPILLFIILNYITPKMMSFFYTTAIGIILLIVVALLLLMGYFVFKKITTIDV